MGVFVGDKVQVQFVARCYSHRILLTHWYRVEQASPPANTVAQDMTALIGAITGAAPTTIEQPYMNCLSGDYSLLAVRAQVIKPVRLAYTEIPRVVSGLGGVSNLSNVSGCLTLRTLNAGRNQVANKHIGPLPDAASLSGRLTVAFKADMDALGDALKATIQPVPGGATYAPIIYHRATDSWDAIVAHVVGDSTRVQRRRTVGVGE